VGFLQKDFLNSLPHVKGWEKNECGILQILQSVEIELGFQIFWQLAFNFAAWSLMISTDSVN
jgi:hypothetical protein